MFQRCSSEDTFSEHSLKNICVDIEIKISSRLDNPTRNLDYT